MKFNRLSLVLAFFSLLSFAGTVYSVENIEPGQNHISIILGAKKEVAIDGIAPLSSDEEILTVQESAPGLVTVTGLRGGDAQIIYWKDGMLQHIDVTVEIAPYFTTQFLTPSFRAGRPYFRYNLSDNSAFTDRSFYDNPTYNQSLNTYVPLGRTASLSNAFSLNSVGLNSDSIAIPVPNTTLNTPKVVVTVGNNTAYSTSVGSAMGSPSFFGSTIVFDPPFASVNDRLTLFGGVAAPNDVRDIRNKDKTGGFYYSLSKGDDIHLNSQYLNMGFFTYQPNNANRYRFSGSIEGNKNLTKNLALDVGVGAAAGGGTALIRPFFQTNRNITSLQYNYTMHGLEKADGTRVSNDFHSYYLNTQQIFKDEISYISLGVSQSFSVQKGSSTTPSSNSLGEQLSFSRYRSDRKSFSVGQSLSHASPSTSHSYSGTFAYDLSLKSVFRQGLSFARTESGSSTSQLMSNSAYEHQDTKLFYSANLGLQWQDSSGSQTEGGSLVGNIKRSFFGGSIGAVFYYNKANIRDSNHQITFSPSLSFQPTSTHLLNVSSSMALNLVGWNTTGLTGSFNIVYSHFFGPGVVRDSLLKRAVQGGYRSKMTGTVFIDKNYNNHFDEGDEPLPDITLSLDDSKTVKTDSGGKFIFKRVKAGEHTVKMDTKRGKIREINFTSDGLNENNLSFPLNEKKATVHVDMILDTNKNREKDEGDSWITINRVSMIDSNGNERFLTTFRGDKYFKSVEVGKYTIRLDLGSIPDNLNLVGGFEQTLDVTAYEDYTVSFFFEPIRTITGTVVFKGGGKLPRELKVKIGRSVANVDQQGRFWIKDIEPGEYNIELLNLPSKFCMLYDLGPRQIRVPWDSFIEKMKIILSSECQPIDKNEPEKTQQP